MRKGWLHGMIKVLFLTIFLGYVGILVFYSHIHVVGGVTIVHAHPFQQDDSAPFHTHSQAEFQLYHVLSSLNAGDDVVPHFIFGILPATVAEEVPVFVCGGICFDAALGCFFAGSSRVLIFPLPYFVF